MFLQTPRPQPAGLTPSVPGDAGSPELAEGVRACVDM